MSDQLAVKNIAIAIKRLPAPKAYGASVITVAVDKLKYTFEKINDQWHFKF
jgi:hypothetical protein